MDFLLSIISEPRRRVGGKAKVEKKSEKTPGKEQEGKTKKTPVKEHEGKTKKTPVEEPEGKTIKVPVLKRQEGKKTTPVSQRKSPAALGSRKRGRSPSVEEQPAAKMPRQTEEMDVASPVAEEEVEETPVRLKKGKKKEKRKTLTPKERTDRESSLNNLTTLMNEPVEATIEGLFSSRKFSEVETLHPFLRTLISEKLGLETMTEIQLKCLRPLLDGMDALVKAQTGSGKTLAYALPIVQRLQAQTPPVTRQTGPLVLVIAPTRELVSQTHDMFEKLLKPFIRIVSGALTGGIRRKAQKASLRRGLNVLVATPQRLLDHLRATACLDLSRLQWLVVDEADRLLEIGFERDVRRILDAIRECRPAGAPPPQTVLLSATLTSKVRAMAGLALTDPVHLAVSDTMETVALPAGLQNFVILPPTKQRLVTLAAFLLLKCRYTSKNGKVIVFLATQDTVDFHFSLFSNTIACASDDLTLPGITSEMELFRLHGKMEHQERQSVFRRFSSCAAGGVLLTTDVACRGLDLPRVAWVVQYHVPGTPVDYVHRVGRTARAGGKGKALLFLQDEERDYLKVLSGLGVHAEEMEVRSVLQAALVHVNNSASVRAKRGKTRLLHSVMEASVRLQRDLEHHVDDSECKALAEQAFLSYLRFYASFSGPMRDIFRFKGLHLGHVARSFALRGAPKDIAARVTGKAPRRHSAPQEQGRDGGADWDLPQRRMDRESARKNMLAEFGI